MCSTWCRILTYAYHQIVFRTRFLVFGQANIMKIIPYYDDLYIYKY